MTKQFSHNDIISQMESTLWSPPPTHSYPMSESALDWTSGGDIGDKLTHPHSNFSDENANNSHFQKCVNYKICLYIFLSCSTSAEIRNQRCILPNPILQMLWLVPGEKKEKSRRTISQSSFTLTRVLHLRTDDCRGEVSIKEGYIAKSVPTHSTFSETKPTTSRSS